MDKDEPRVESRSQVRGHKQRPAGLPGVVHSAQDRSSLPPGSARGLAHGARAFDRWLFGARPAPRVLTRFIWKSFEDAPRATHRPQLARPPWRVSGATGCIAGRVQTPADRRWHSPMGAGVIGPPAPKMELTTPPIGQSQGSRLHGGPHGLGDGSRDNPRPLEQQGGLTRMRVVRSVTDGGPRPSLLSVETSSGRLARGSQRDETRRLRRSVHGGRGNSIPCVRPAPGGARGRVTSRGRGRKRA